MIFSTPASNCVVSHYIFLKDFNVKAYFAHYSLQAAAYTLVPWLKRPESYLT